MLAVALVVLLLLLLELLSRRHVNVHAAGVAQWVKKVKRSKVK